MISENLIIIVWIICIISITSILYSIVMLISLIINSDIVKKIWCKLFK